MKRYLIWTARSFVDVAESMPDYRDVLIFSSVDVAMFQL